MDVSADELGGVSDSPYHADEQSSDASPHRYDVMQSYPYDYYPNTYYPYYYNNPGYAGTSEASHSFSYAPEYNLAVENPSGGSVEKVGWKQKDEVITLTTPERIDGSSQERGVFKAWNVDGSETLGSTVTLTMNMPHKARAIYQTQYYLEVRSDLGNPQGSGWYDQGSTATVSVYPEVEIPGFWGSLGGRYVFERWDGMTGGNQFSARTTVAMDGPMTMVAVWRQDYSTPSNILTIILVVIVVLIAAAFIVTTRRLKKSRPRGEQSALDALNLRYSRGEISRKDYLKMKKDIEF
jgi:hypothetical protein